MRGACFVLHVSADDFNIVGGGGRMSSQVSKLFCDGDDFDDFTALHHMRDLIAAAGRCTRLAFFDSCACDSGYCGIAFTTDIN